MQTSTIDIRPQSRKTVSRNFGWFALANLLLPGLGHGLLREVLFGTFIFLIMLIAAVLAVISLLVPLGTSASLFIFGLPLLFYAFSFVDLYRTWKTRPEKRRVNRNPLVLCLTAGLVYQLASPTAPGNFFLRNRPSLFRAPDNSFAPQFSTGDLLASNSLAYVARIPFMAGPILHHTPERYDLVRFAKDSLHKEIGIVIGLPGEQIQIVDGMIVVDELLADAQPFGFTLTTEAHDYALDGGELLIGHVRLGVIHRFETVSFRQVEGRVRALLR